MLLITSISQRFGCLLSSRHLSFPSLQFVCTTKPYTILPIQHSTRTTCSHQRIFSTGHWLLGAVLSMAVFQKRHWKNQQLLIQKQWQNWSYIAWSCYSDDFSVICHKLFQCEFPLHVSSVYKTNYHFLEMSSLICNDNVYFFCLYFSQTKIHHHPQTVPRSLYIDS